MVGQGEGPDPERAERERVRALAGVMGRPRLLSSRDFWTGLVAGAAVVGSIGAFWPVIKAGNAYEAAKDRSDWPSQCDQGLRLAEEWEALGFAGHGRAWRKELELTCFIAESRRRYGP